MASAILSAMDNEQLRALATKRIKAKSDYKYFLLIWLGVSIVLTVIYLVTNPGGYFWPGWAIGGMGIAAIFQGIAAYGPDRSLVPESKIEAEMHRIRGTTPPPA